MNIEDGMNEFGDIKDALEKELKEYLQPFLEKIPPEYKQTAEEWRKEAGDYIKANPLKSVAFAFLAGVVVTRILKR